MIQAAEERNSLTRILHFAEYDKKSGSTAKISAIEGVKVNSDLNKSESEKNVSSICLIS